MAYTIVGCGYTGRRLAARCRREGEDVIALVRSGASREALDRLGVTAHRLDLDEPVAGGLPPSFTEGRCLIYMVPPEGSGAEDGRLARFLDALGGRPRCLVYLSTSGVYGDRAGARVNEDTPPAPGSDRSRRRLDAETRARRWGDATGVPVRILRVPGIYGPGRLPVDRLRRGEPALAPDPGRPGNRIHVDDLVGVCLAACAYAGDRSVFNVGDGDATDAGTFSRMLAEAAGLPAPPTRTLAEMMAAASPMGREFLRESRRLDVRRMREELGYRPIYSDPRAGIEAALAEMARAAQDGSAGGRDRDAT